MKTYKGQITTLPPNGIFVFGSNTEGRHGKGAALVAKEKFGAILGQPGGMQGRSYGIITKDLTKNLHPSIPSFDIILQINTLYFTAKLNPDKEYYIAYSGTGSNLNGYTPQEMAGFFSSKMLTYQIPDNVVFEEEFAKMLNK